MGGPNLEVFKVSLLLPPFSIVPQIVTAFWNPLSSLEKSITADQYGFKFGMYVMFPIAWMYYFGTNLESRFSVPDFWPKPESSHRIPFERAEMQEELERLKNKRLEKRARRLEMEGKSEGGEERAG